MRSTTHLEDIDPRNVEEQRSHAASCPTCKLLYGATSLFSGQERAQDPQVLDRLVAHALPALTAASALKAQRWKKGGAAVRVAQSALRMAIGPATAIIVAVAVYSAIHVVHVAPVKKAPVVLAGVAAPVPSGSPGVVAPSDDPPPAPGLAPPAPSSSRKVAPPVTALSPPPSAIDAASLFRDANALRRQDARAEAIAMYAELGRRFPSSREALTSRVIVGNMLSPKDSAGALREFEAYLRDAPNGTLAEEARVGRAMALEALGRAGEERDAWEEVLRKHPETLSRDRAEGRLRVLR